MEVITMIGNLTLPANEAARMGEICGEGFRYVWKNQQKYVTAVVQ